uniref:glycosyltransferase n=1 Tax=Blastomonas sp. TaxID=1909299 RepID=UPI00359415D1
MAGLMGETLFLAHRIPFPPDRGDKIRSCHLLRALAALGPVHVATFAETDADLAAELALAEVSASHLLVHRTVSNVRAGLRALASGLPLSLAAFASEDIALYVSRLLVTRPIATIVVFSGQMAQFIPADFAGRVIMDFVDMDSAKFAAYAQQSRGPMRAIHAREARLLGAFEQQIARRASVSTFVSQAEAALFREGLNDPLVRIEALGNGIDTLFYDPEGVAPAPYAETAGPHLVFTGQMDYPPNVEAVASFAREVLPVVRAAHGDAQFHIVGRNPASEVKVLASLSGINVVGEVADIRPWIASADVIV